MTNKVQFGLDMVHIAPITSEDPSTGVIVYEKPFRLPGAVTMTFDAAGDTTNFPADNNANYYTTTANNGYTGTLSIANLTEEFRTKILGDVLVNGGLAEKSDAKVTAFALLFETSGDTDDTRYVYYKVTATRPSLSANTTSTTKDPDVQELNFTAAARADKFIRWNTGETTTEEIYDGFFTKVVEPVEV